MRTKKISNMNLLIIGILIEMIYYKNSKKRDLILRKKIKQNIIIIAVNLNLDNNRHKIVLIRIYKIKLHIIIMKLVLLVKPLLKNQIPFTNHKNHK